jgi:hypothetical protein
VAKKTGDCGGKPRLITSLPAPAPSLERIADAVLSDDLGNGVYRLQGVLSDVILVNDGYFGMLHGGKFVLGGDENVIDTMLDYTRLHLAMLEKRQVVFYGRLYDKNDLIRNDTKGLDVEKYEVLE